MIIESSLAESESYLSNKPPSGNRVVAALSVHLYQHAAQARHRCLVRHRDEIIQLSVDHRWGDGCPLCLLKTEIAELQESSESVERICDSNQKSEEVKVKVRSAYRESRQMCSLCVRGRPK